CILFRGRYSSLYCRFPEKNARGFPAGRIYVHLSAIIRPAGKPLAFFSGNRQYRDEYLPLSANFRRETWKG
ncbi:MAG TPA: hypothetical protein PLA83_02095, partial [Deltaproteobacteria bacterium]|nr:hypothetical protein [Deltaproteobacteria bacterium]